MPMLRIPLDRVSARIAALLAAGACMLCPSSHANADWGEISRLSTPPVSTRTVELFESTVRPTEEQRELASDLAELAESELQALLASWKTIRAGYERDQERGEFSFDTMNEFFSRIPEFRDAREKITAQFLDTLQLSLDPEQAEDWARFESRMKREDFVRTQFADVDLAKPYAIDVAQIVDEARLTPKQVLAARPITDQYAEDIDRLHRELADLIEKDNLLTMRFTEAMASVAPLAPDERGPARERVASVVLAIAELDDQIESVGGRLAETHRRYVRSVSSTLEPGAAARLVDLYNNAAFPKIFQETRTHQFFQSAITLEALDDDQAREVRALSNAFERDLRPIRETIAEEILKSVSVDALTGSRYPSRTETPIQRTATQDIRALQSRYNRELADLLTQDQRDEVFGDEFTDWRSIDLSP